MGILSYLNDPIWTYSRWGIFALVVKSAIWTLLIVGVITLALYLRRRRINPFDFRRWNWAWLGGGIAYLWQHTVVKVWNWAGLPRFWAAFMTGWRAAKATYNTTPTPAPTTAPTPAPAPATTPTPAPAPATTPPATPAP